MEVTRSDEYSLLPVSNVQSYMTCQWLFRLPPQSEENSIKVRFAKIDLQGAQDSGRCHDYVAVGMT